MQTNQLGSNGPDLSVIGYGAWEAGGTNWGPNESDDAVIAAMRAAIDAGINWIDTAEVYGKGVSESLVGRAVAGRRDEVVIASKVAPQPEGSGFRPEQVHRACEASLGRLDIDVIDLYQLHWPDDQDTPIEDTWGAMVELQEAGRVRWIGVSNFSQDLIERCLAIHHVDSLQPEFSTLNRRNAELIRWCGEQGVGVVSYGPLAFGLLTGAITQDTVFPEGDWRGSEDEEDDPDEDDVDLFDPDTLPQALATVERLRPVADRLGITLSQLALAWNVNQAGVTSAIAGSRNPDHVRANAEAGDVKLDDATLAEVDALLS
ncbi:MAG TPA: aldo/keto reductase [Actinomycetota bacterium]|jgi:aryl-alcohol dehydrogenase-like predicted oxidoreductase